MAASIAYAVSTIGIGSAAIISHGAVVSRAPVENGVAPIYPITGGGPAGAAGPGRIILSRLNGAGTSTFNRGSIPLPGTPNLTNRSLQSAPLHIRSSDATVREGDFTFESFLNHNDYSARRGALVSNFLSAGAIDVGGASNGAFITTTNEYGDIHVFNQAGGLIESVAGTTFYCGGAVRLPVCSTPGGFLGDARVEYDTGAQRWVFTGLWINSTPVQSVLAVSQSSNPAGAYNLYQFPSCGQFDTWDRSDQPHTGFNNQWIVSTAACSANPKNPNQLGTSLAVFDKNSLYAGQALTLNRNWFEFVDPVEIPGNRDNPVATYSGTVNNREYLTASIIAGGYAAEVYSHVEGSVDAPVFYSKTTQVTTSFAATYPPAISAPGCSSCMSSDANGWTHSSAVYPFRNGQAYIMSTFVLGDPRYNPSTQIISIAENTITGAATALQFAGGIAGSGPLAAEIAMPLAPSNASNNAIIAYDQTRFDFYPGVKDALWNVDTNSVQYVNTLIQGTVTPTADESRWVDFLDAMSPIPGSSQIMLGGSVARPSPNDSQRSTYYAIITP